jgi:BioD-like phosphotransacetylase family protein
MLAAALIELLRRDGQRVAYCKAFTADDAAPEAAPDARFLGTLLQVASPRAGATLGPTTVRRLLEGAPFDREAVVTAAREAGTNADTLIVEGGATLTQGLAAGVSLRDLAEALSARVLVVARYEGDEVVDELLAAPTLVGQRLLGVVVTAVPRQQWPGARERIGAFLRARDVPFLGALPYEDRLEAVTVRQLAEHLGGQILNSEDHAEAVIEHVMVGTVVLGKASEYFARFPRKAVIAHGSRPDMHLAALETDTRCLVLAGNIVPNPIVLARAEEEQVPIIMVRQDTLAVLEQVEELFPRAPFAAAANVGLAADLAAAHLDLSAVRTPAGTAS